VHWKQITARPGNKMDEVLVGAIELHYTKELTIGGQDYYFIHFDKKQENNLKDEIASYNAQRLTDEEISRIINTPSVL
jgi:UDP-N-acetylglucosamine 4,6-dehydratase/5-epimerase